MEVMIIIMLFFNRYLMMDEIKGEEEACFYVLIA